jgi:hypothetical protein
MRLSRQNNNTNKTRVVVITADSQFEESVRATFAAAAAIDLRVISGTVAGAGDKFDTEGVTVVVIDLDATRDDEMLAL